MDKFILHSQYKPTGDQPEAIDKLAQGVLKNMKNQVLLGVTGSGKTFTMANVTQQVNRPTLFSRTTKTLAAQLGAEFKEYFPENAVDILFHYYDYYQPRHIYPAENVYRKKTPRS